MASDSDDSDVSIWSSDTDEELRNPKFLSLQLKAFCLSVLQSFGGNDNNIEDGNLKDLLIHIRTVFVDVCQDLQRLSVLSEEYEKRTTMHMDDLYSSVLERLVLLNPDIQQIYKIISKSTNFITGMSHEAVMKNLRNLLANMTDLMSYKPELVAPVKAELEAAQTSLRFLRNFLGFTAKRCNKLEKLRDLLNHAEFLVRNMSCLFYLCSVNDRMNDRMVKEMKIHLSFELQKFSPAQPEVREIYIEALKASKFGHGVCTVVNVFDLCFFDSLRDRILELSDSQFSSIASEKVQILSLHEELRLLILSFAMYKPHPCADRDHSIKDGILELYQVSNYFLELISTVLPDMGFLIYSLYNEQNTDEAKELKTVVSNLKDTIRIAKEDSRKAHETYIPKSWRVKIKFRATNAQDMIRSLKRILERIPYSLGHLCELLQEEMQSLIVALGKLTAKQHLENGELEIQLSRLNDIKNETVGLKLSLSKASCHVWNQNLWAFILIEKIRMIKKEFKYLQNQMMQDTSTINQKRKKTMTDDNAEIYEDEPERTGEQLFCGSKKPHSLPGIVGMRGTDDRNSNLDLICPVKDELKALKEGFLKVFLSCKGIWHIEDENLKVLPTCIHSVFQSADQDLQSLWSDLNIQTSPKKVQCLPINMDCLLPRVLSRLQLLEPEYGAYAKRLKSSTFIAGTSDEGHSDESLAENLNALVENIEVLVKCNSEVVAPLKEELEAVQKSLRFLRNFLGFIVTSLDLLIHSEFLAVKLSCLLYLCCDNEKMNDQMVNEMKMQLSSELQKVSPTHPDVRKIYIKALKASKSAKGNSNSATIDEFVLGFLHSLQDYILELSNNNLSFIGSNKEQILFLLEELKFLTTFLTMDIYWEEHSEHEKMLKFLFEHIKVLIIDTGCVIYLLNDDENDEMLSRELNKKVSDLLADFMVTKADIKKIYDLYVPRLLRFDFPKTNGQGYIGSLLRNINELLDTKSDLVAPLKNHIEIVQKKLLSLREDFGKIAEHRRQCDELRSQWVRFLDTAYQTEFIIDSFAIGGDPIYCHKIGLFNVVEEIKTITIELKAIKIKTIDETSVHRPSSFSTQNSVVESNFPKNNAIPSSKEGPAHEKKIRVHLTNGSQKLNIISIVGMPGIGKTTLADSVFQHSEVTCHFHVQARCSVSQAHDKRRLLVEILQQVTAESKQCSDDDDDLDHKLYKSLKGRRYLILLDDLWDIQAWEDIKSSFPDDEKGSRIVFTSRFVDIASQTLLESTKYHLLPLSKEKSWDMLQVKLFGNKSCPPELVRVGHEIASNCNGLPLTIDLVAGVLRMKERKEWKMVAEWLMTILLEDPQGRCWKVLELSYQNLPDDLKPCFLYFAAFPEDANVPTRDLILLWIAEGFVKLEMSGKRSLEDEAEDILNNLIRRSLVTVSKRGPLGGVVESRVHDLLHEFAIAKAQEESFMLKINGKGKFSTLSSVCANDQWQGRYRLCTNSNYWMQFLESVPSGTCYTRALFSFHNSGSAVSLNFSTFKLLRVLYIPKATSSYCPAMFTLIHLRLLAISAFQEGGIDMIISNIHKLWNLETFITKVHIRDVRFLLDKICNMARLRHLCFQGYIHFRYLREEIWQKASFANLQTLHNLKASYDEDIEKILKLMPNLVELKVLFYISSGYGDPLNFLKKSESPDGYRYPFPKLDFLKKLKSLEMDDHEGYLLCPCNIPPYLERLVLSRFDVPWTEISEIENLEYLEALELKKGSFRGPIWDMIDGQFPRLKYLSLSDLDIEEWNASEDHLSCLEQLHVTNCTKLKELPSCLAEIATPQVIKLSYCTKAARNSAKRIKEEQEQIGNEQLVVDISKVLWEDDWESEDDWEDD